MFVNANEKHSLYFIFQLNRIYCENIGLRLFTAEQFLFPRNICYSFVRTVNLLMTASEAYMKNVDFVKKCISNAAVPQLLYERALHIALFVPVVTRTT